MSNINFMGRLWKRLLAQLYICVDSNERIDFSDSGFPCSELVVLDRLRFRRARMPNGLKIYFLRAVVVFPLRNCVTECQHVDEIRASKGCIANG
jgi:hypothetical protein